MKPSFFEKFSQCAHDNSLTIINATTREFPFTSQKVVIRRPMHYQDFVFRIYNCYSSSKVCDILSCCLFTNTGFIQIEIVLLHIISIPVRL